MPNPTRFPSALRRSDGGDIDLDTSRRREASAAAIAMMDAETYKRYMQRKGQFAEPDREAIAEMGKRDPSGLRRW